MGDDGEGIPLQTLYDKIIQMATREGENRPDPVLLEQIKNSLISGSRSTEEAKQFEKDNAKYSGLMNDPVKDAKKDTSKTVTNLPKNLSNMIKENSSVVLLGLIVYLFYIYGK